MNSGAVSRFVICIAALVAALTTSAYAGPPLICHAIEIGPAKTLPPIDWNYQNGVGGYDLQNLTRDTMAILDSNASVLVRMETLRRATIYARQDEKVARELLARLHARAANSDGAGDHAALAWFDAGYLAEAYKQWIEKGKPNPATGLDGYAWIKKALQLRGQDPEMEFATALITLAGPEGEHADHVRKAMAGAKNDPLLAQNLAARFGQQTVAELLARVPAGGFQK
jgi:hypothetical protein